MRHDIDSTNGILVGERTLRSGDEGMRLSSGVILHFGREGCEFIDGGELYEILAASRDALHTATF